MLKVAEDLQAAAVLNANGITHFSVLEDRHTDDCPAVSKSVAQGLRNPSRALVVNEEEYLLSVQTA
jgi:hypothetical protein